MSTRSAIIIKRGSKDFVGIYCHSDGYPSYNGRILRDHYQDVAKIEALIKLGDISSLAANVAPPKGKKQTFDYDSRLKDVVCAYGRDRGETGTEPKRAHTLKDVRNQIEHEYYYVYDVASGQWSVNGKALAPVVEDALYEQAKETIEQGQKILADPEMAKYHDAWKTSIMEAAELVAGYPGLVAARKAARPAPKPDSPAFNAKLAIILKANFPWLGTDDEANGADVVDQLNVLYEKVASNV